MRLPKKTKTGDTIPTILDTLTDWTEQYIKNKDLLTKHITSITRHDNGWTFTVIRKDGTQHVLVAVQFAHEFLNKITPDLNACIVLLNTHKNIEHVAEHWNQLIALPKLCLIFANPDATGDKRWIIFPHTHDKIIERKTLKRGLESLYLTVDPAEEPR